MQDFEIVRAEKSDLQEILDLQYLAYQSEAALFGTQDIPPLKQTIDEVIVEYNNGVILKVECKGQIIGSIRAKFKDNTVYIGKLMVHPQYRNKGIGKKLLKEIESVYPDCRYELFTSTLSINNLRLYESIGYKEYERQKVNDMLTFVYLEKR